LLEGFEVTSLPSFKVGVLKHGSESGRSLVVRYWPVALILLGLEYVVASRDRENCVGVSVGSIILLALALCFAGAYV